MENRFKPSVFRERARTALVGKWGASALITLILLFFVGSLSCTPLLFRSSGIFANLFMLLVGSMIMIGSNFIWWDVANGKEVKIGTLLEPFNDYRRYLLGYLLMGIYVFLWTLLLIVPGIIKGISYGMTYYIMRENPEMSGESAIKLSMKMMNGHKMDLFLLGLSFIGWILLCIVTLGIGLLWIIPYISTSYGAFYEELKKEYAERQPIEELAAPLEEPTSPYLKSY